MQGHPFSRERFKKSILLVAALLGPALPAFAGTCTVDATQTNQIIRGFGAASAWNAQSIASPW